ncbi:hypothetical protein [Streptomyces californicus]|uniref:hypothetical protein n=1 Tax=Streptomyces californicus TaxID=67351 RepID=UPI00296FD598|nr:hypothetical protein [Streptomyces californicus]MDW4912529.1 hypothetical protein [Streptomyces californicus]
MDWDRYFNPGPRRSSANVTAIRTAAIRSEASKAASRIGALRIDEPRRRAKRT